MSGVVLEWSSGGVQVLEAEGMPCRISVAMDGAASVTVTLVEGQTIVVIEATVPPGLSLQRRLMSGGGV